MNNELKALCNQVVMGECPRRIMVQFGFHDIESVFVRWPENPALFFQRLMREEPRESEIGKRLWGTRTRHLFLGQSKKTPASYTFNGNDRQAFSDLRQLVFSKMIK